MRIFLQLLLTVAISCLAAPAFSEPTSFNWLQDVEFLDLSSCNQNSDFSPLCGSFSGGFKDWSEADKAFVVKALQGMNLPKISVLREALRTAGLKKVQFLLVKEGVEHAGTTVRNSDAVIALYPNFFASPVAYAGVSEAVHVLIHESVHIWAKLTSDSSYFSNPFWRQLSEALEWRYPVSAHRLIDGEERKRLARLRSELVHKGQPQEAVKADFAFSRPMGFPSLYSMMSIEEYFAELVAFLTHDEKMQSALPDTVVSFMKKSEFGALVAGASPEPVAGANEREATSNFSFVGVIVVESQPLCTAFLVAPGVAVTAKHCVESLVEGVPESRRSVARFPFLELEFKSGGPRTLVSGLDITVDLDSGESDFAYLRFNPDLTKDIVIPKIEMPGYPAQQITSGVELFTVGYPVPLKLQTLKRVVTPACAFTGVARRDSAKPNLNHGILYGTTCAAWYGASGSPILSRKSSDPSTFILWGVLTHTFSVADESGRPDSSKIQNDAWGSYTDSNFSPVYGAADFPLANVQASLTIAQRGRIEFLEQKLREWLDLKKNSHPSLRMEEVKLRAAVRLTLSLDLTAEQIRSEISQLLQMKERGREESLLDDEGFYSSDVLSQEDQGRVLEELDLLLKEAAI